jgi:hypothetical protein
MNKVSFLEFIGPVSDTVVNPENELEVGRRTSLDKFDRYFYTSRSPDLFGNNGRPYIPSK